MNAVHIFWEHSPLWLLPVFLLALFLSWWQYSGNIPFSRRLALLLAGIRTITFFLAGLLLLNPLLRFFRENRLPPISVILIDNSRSIKLAGNPDSLRIFQEKIIAVKKQLESAGSLVFTENLKGPVDNPGKIVFDQGSTNLEAALRRISSSYEGQNLAQVILASDGIINEGSDLQDAVSPFRIHTIALGNPNPGKDLRISGIRHNKLVYLGNQFPVNVEIQARGTRSSQVSLRLMEGGKLIETKTVGLSPSGLAKAGFSLKALQKGMHEYTVELEAESGEITLENNRRNFFIEVVSEKQKVLLLASCPHPDLKAIRAALEPLEQVELTTLIAGIDPYRPEQYSLVILHQLPDVAGSFGPQVSQFLRKSGTALWLIATPFTDFGRLRNEAGSWINLQGGKGQPEESGNRFEENFQRFSFDEKDRQTLSLLPPVKSPGASFSWKGASETILSQLIGRVASPTPLLSVQTEKDSRRAIFWGDGLWLWRLNEFGKNENTEASDKLIEKTCQLLLSSAKKKQLQVSSMADEYAETDAPSFRVETFNQLMEPVFDKQVKLSISRNGGKPTEYSLITATGNPLLRTQALPAGVYHFSASALIDGKELKDEGDFIVRSFDVEARQLEANHSLLQAISKSGNGLFTHISDMEKIGEKSELPPPLLEFTDWNENLLGVKWMLAMILFFLSAEWLIRKLNGAL